MNTSYPSLQFPKQNYFLPKTLHTFLLLRCYRMYSFFANRSAEIPMYTPCLSAHACTFSSRTCTDHGGASAFPLQVTALNGEVVRHNSPEFSEDSENLKISGSRAHIYYHEDFRFFLMQHWTLQKSMYYSNYVASKLGLWRDRSNNKLQTLLARMGLSLVEADQKYANMKGELKKKLPDKLDTVAAEFGLTDVRFPTFKKQRGYGSTIFAADCVHIASAMLHYTQNNDYRWADCFFKAHDALLVCLHACVCVCLCHMYMCTCIWADCIFMAHDALLLCQHVCMHAYMCVICTCVRASEQTVSSRHKMLCWYVSTYACVCVCHIRMYACTCIWACQRV